MKGETTLTDEQLDEYVVPMPGHPTADLDRIDSVVKGFWMSTQSMRPL